MLQLLGLAGVTTYGMASSPKHALVTKLGALPIDYRDGPIDRLVRSREPNGVDFAFDALGGKSISQCLSAVKRGGLVVGYGFLTANSQLAQARMFFDTFVTSRLRGRRGAFYGISLLYRRDARPFLEDLPKILRSSPSGGSSRSSPRSFRSPAPGRRSNFSRPARSQARWW